MDHPCRDRSPRVSQASRGSRRRRAARAASGGSAWGSFSKGGNGTKDAFVAGQVFVDEEFLVPHKGTAVRSAIRSLLVNIADPSGRRGRKPFCRSRLERRSLKLVATCS